MYNSWDVLRNTMSGNGVTLKGAAIDQGFAPEFTYVTFDSDGDGATEDDYYFIFQVNGVPGDMTGAQIEVRPAMISRQTF